MNAQNELPDVYDFLSPALAKKNGIRKSDFYRMIQKNGLERIRRGIYVDQSAWVDELALAHLRCPQAIFSHDEAFYHYGLTDREPLCPTLTIYSGYNPQRLTDSGYKVYTVKKELLEVGKTEVMTQCGNPVPMYDLERTICDLIRSRNKMEAQEVSSVLKAYLRKKEKNLNRLMEYAALLRVDRVMRSYMEVLL